jgi:hypothetical protein
MRATSMTAVSTVKIGPRAIATAFAAKDLAEVEDVNGKTEP